MIAHFLLIPFLLSGQYKPAGPVFPHGGGGGPVFVNYAIGVNTGVDTPATVTYTCTTTGDPVWAAVIYSGAGITGYALTSTVTMTINTNSNSGAQYVYAGVCPDTSPHLYTFTFTCTSCGGLAQLNIVETTGHLDDMGPNQASPPIVTSLDATVTATAASGMCVVFGQSHSWTPTPPAGWTLAFSDGENNILYDNTCYGAPGVITFTAPLGGASAARYETSIVAVHI